MATPVMLGIVSTIVGKIFQHSSQKHAEKRQVAQQKAKEREIEMAEDTQKAMEIFEDVTKKTDSILSAMEGIFVAVTQGDEELKERMSQRYREIIWGWRSSETLTLTLIESYFGKSVLDEYTIQMESLKSLRADLAYIERAKDDISDDELELASDSFFGGLSNTRNYLRILNEGMIKLIQSKKVGRFLPEREASA